MYREKERTLTFFLSGVHATQPEAYTLIVEVGEAFDTLLASGVHQQHFVGLPD